MRRATQFFPRYGSALLLILQFYLELRIVHFNKVIDDVDAKQPLCAMLSMRSCGRPKQETSKGLQSTYKFAKITGD